MNGLHEQALRAGSTVGRLAEMSCSDAQPLGDHGPCVVVGIDRQGRGVHGTDFTSGDSGIGERLSGDGLEQLDRVNDAVGVFVGRVRDPGDDR